MNRPVIIGIEFGNTGIDGKIKMLIKSITCFYKSIHNREIGIGTSSIGVVVISRSQNTDFVFLITNSAIVFLCIVHTVCTSNTSTDTFFIIFSGNNVNNTTHSIRAI